MINRISPPLYGRKISYVCLLDYRIYQFGITFQPIFTGIYIPLILKFLASSYIFKSIWAKIPGTVAVLACLFSDFLQISPELLFSKRFDHITHLPLLHRARNLKFKYSDLHCFSAFLRLQN